MMNGFSKVYWVWSSLDFVGEKVMFDGLCETYWIYVCLIPYFTKKKLYFWEPPARIKSFISKFQFQGRYWDLLCHSSRLRQRTKLIIETEIFYILHLHFISQAIHFLRDGFKKKKKLMEFSIKLAGWVLDAPVFH